MNGKMTGKTGSSAFTSDGMRAEILNPFVHKLELDNTYDKIKTAIFTIILLPFRVIVICFLIVSAWMIACVGLYGLSEEDLRTKPMSGWRSKLRFYILSLMRLVVVVAGFHRVRIVGRSLAAASSREAPVVVMAPHSTFFDAIAIVCLGAPSVVAKADTARLPFIGQLINYTQPVYLWRDDPNSRQKSIKEIISRATSKEEWPQVLIFPEGTCTNRSCLITFKPGGFYPGVPVQPVTIRYPNSLDTVTWTWEGPGALKLLWLTLTQIHSSCEIEFLPVYYPSEEEKKDPKLYARNVRDVMAKALGVPVLEYTYEDCKLIARAKQLGLPAAAHVRDLANIHAEYGLSSPVGVVSARPRWSSREELSARLRAPPPAAEHIYNIFVQPQSGMVYIPDYLLCSAFLERPAQSPAELLKYAFTILGSGLRLEESEWVEGAGRCAALSPRAALAIYHKLQRDSHISYDDFIAYAQKRSELAYIFQTEAPQQKSKSQ